jgi:DnaB-like helicase N terminal domain
MTGQARRELGRCQARWDALPEPIRREPPVTDVVDAAESGSDLRWRQAQAGAAAGACTGPADTDEAGARVLRDLAAGPSQISAVSAWLRPGHFSRAGHGALYDVMRDLAGAGQPVDSVTVSWAASCRGIEADAADLAGGMAPFAVANAREVHRQGLLAQIARAGHDIEATTEDQRSAPGLVLRVTGERLRSIELGQRPGAWQPVGSASRAGPGAG